MTVNTPDLTPEQVGATGCAIAWADHIMDQIGNAGGYLGGTICRADLRDWIAALLNGLNADHAARVAAVEAGESLTISGTDAPIVIHHSV